MGKKATGQAKQKISEAKTNHAGNISDKGVWAFTAIVFAIYYGYSFYSTGFYQDDEVGHYFNMRQFWTDPGAIVSPWAKFGYKLFYVLPSLMGSNAMVAFNCLVAAFTCFLTFKTAQKIGIKHSVFAFILLATQYFWVEMSFRNYADPFGGLILLTAIYFHYSEKYYLSAFFLSYASIIRQEFNVLIVLYGLYLLYNKKILPALLLGLFPLVYNFCGYLKTGNIFFLFSSSEEFAARQAGAYAHYGFGNFSVMSMVTFGAMQVTLVVLCLIELFFETFASKQIDTGKTGENNKHYLFFLIPMLLYFFIHSLIDSGWLNWGASGSLRYMTSIAPLVAITGSLALDKLEKFPKKLWLFYSMIVFAIIVSVFMTYKYVGTMFSDETRDFVPLIITIGTIIIAFLPITGRQRLTAFIIASFVFFILVIRPIKSTPEQDTMKIATQFALAQGYLKDDRQVLTNHIFFKYFYDKKMNSIYKNIDALDTVTAMKAPIGTILVWDTHYGFKEKSWPKTANMDWYQKKGNFEVKKDFVSSNQRFQVVIMQKVR